MRTQTRTMLLIVCCLIWLGAMGRAGAQTTATYDLTNSALAQWGSWSATYAGSPSYRMLNPQASLATDFTGTKIEGNLFGGAAGIYTATVDGNAVSVSSAAGGFNWVTIADNLSDGLHHLVLSRTFSSGTGAVMLTGAVRVTGAAPAIALPRMTAGAGERYIVFDGDSRTAGVASTVGIGSTQGTNFPSFSLAAVANGISGANNGISGATATTLSAQAASNIDSQYNPVRAVNVCVFFGGFNDVDLSGQGATAVENTIANYHIARRAAGWKTVAMTLPHDNNSADNATLDTINVWLRANWQTFADGFADPAADPRLTDATNMTYFSSDNIHFVDAGYKAIAQVATPALYALVGFAPAAPTVTAIRQEIDANSTRLASLVSGQTTLTASVAFLPTAASFWTYGTRTLTAQADTPGTGTLLTRLGTPTGASIDADILASPAATVIAFKADIDWRKMLAYSAGKFTFVPSTGVLTLYDRDGATPITTLTLTKDGAGNTTQRTAQ